MLTYRETIEFSGNSTIQVVIMDKTSIINNIRDIFNTFGCKSEKFAEGYFVLEVIAGKDYQQKKNKLTELQDEGIIDYEESCLSEKHFY